MNNSFESLYNLQVEFQKQLLDKDLYLMLEKMNLPVDCPKIFSQHVQHLISEIGEVLSADKRWKTYRNEKYDEDAKLEELADCFIVLMNMCIFSGVEATELYDTIESKIEKNKKRIENL